MTFTYTGNLATPLDRVRFAIGDRVQAEAQCTDEEIVGALSVNGGNEIEAAIACFDMLSADYAKRATFQTGDTAQNLSDVSKAYKAQADDLRRRHGVENVVRVRKTYRRYPTDGDVIAPLAGAGSFDVPPVVNSPGLRGD